MSKFRLVVYPCISFVVGLAAGMLGIGGGIIYGPLLLYLGYHPQIVSATTATMVMFTSGIASLQYSVFGNLESSFSVQMWLLGFIVTLLGQLAMNHFVERLKKPSLVVFSIATVLLLSSISMIIESYRAIFTATRLQIEPTTFC